jgi:sulfur carrier protein ThiS
MPFLWITKDKSIPLGKFAGRLEGNINMIEITFNAFSFLRAKLKRSNIDFTDARRQLPEGTTAKAFIESMGLQGEEVEGVFVNNKIVPMDTVLQQGDRVALVPPGTPGPYRVMLGMVAMKKGKGGSGEENGSRKNQADLAG